MLAAVVSSCPRWLYRGSQFSGKQTLGRGILCTVALSVIRATLVMDLEFTEKLSDTELAVHVLGLVVDAERTAVNVKRTETARSMCSTTLIFDFSVMLLLLLSESLWPV